VIGDVDDDYFFSNESNHQFGCVCLCVFVCNLGGVEDLVVR